MNFPILEAMFQSNSMVNSLQYQDLPPPEDQSAPKHREVSKGRQAEAVLREALGASSSCHAEGNCQSGPIQQSDSPSVQGTGWSKRWQWWPESRPSRSLIASLETGTGVVFMTRLASLRVGEPNRSTGAYLPNFALNTSCLQIGRTRSRHADGAESGSMNNERR